MFEGHRRLYSGYIRFDRSREGGARCDNRSSRAKQSRVKKETQEKEKDGGSDGPSMFRRRISFVTREGSQ